MEAQLESMGLLDGLLCQNRICKMKELCPEFLDTVIYVPAKGASNFSKLVLNEELTSGNQRKCSEDFKQYL